MALIKRRVVAPANLDKQSTGSHLSRVAKLTDDGVGGGGGHAEPRIGIVYTSINRKMGKGS